ncbi:hypothetical protein [Leuconostoc litchii]|uniref:DUF308 domain-containing protein n=1 Tax=Leuconostoc litchii TaxID=1981069 RepID=A0A6P2CP88_9LACO|nr:hypothetical protein [Leuconostoc litchii]TYC46922.1 hypothetical protein ESZ47_01905 [Leuconostoc litchii]
MIFIFIILFLLSILLVGFTIQNKQRYGTFIVPLIFTLLCVSGTIISGLQLPAAIQKIQKKNVANSSLQNNTNSKNQSSSNLKNNNTTEISDITTKQQQAKLSLQEKELTQKLDTAYNKIGDVSFISDTKTFQLKIYSGSELAQSISQIENDPSLAEEAHWSDFTNSLIETSKNINKSFKSGYTFELMGVNDSNKVLFSAKDGQEISSITK